MVHKSPESNDKRWIYVPAVDLVKPISADDKNSSFVGSDFTYEDVSGRHWSEDNHTLLEESELDGKPVVMPGYALPLEYAGTKVTEFLLVPWVGACIHTPPPPANQIVHVVVDENQASESKGLFEPVSVTGTMFTKQMSKSLYLVDGSSDINIGYSIQASMVEPYTNKTKTNNNTQTKR